MSRETVRGVFLFGLLWKEQFVAEEPAVTLKLELEDASEERASKVLPLPTAAGVQRPFSAFI